jgi:hypothetical protein
MRRLKCMLQKKMPTNEQTTGPTEYIILHTTRGKLSTEKIVKVQSCAKYVYSGNGANDYLYYLPDNR